MGTEDKGQGKGEEEKPVGTITISIWPSSDVSVEGTPSILGNKLTMYGMIGCLHEMIIKGEFQRRSKSPILTPRNSKHLILPK